MSGNRAVIDIGSNTIRLVIYGGPSRAPVVLHNEKITAKLGKGVAETGVLSDKSMSNALAALARYVKLLDIRGIEDVQAVATAAVRDARNGGDFLNAVRALGLDARLLSGEEEAVTSAIGVVAASPGAKGVVADLGGGSLELVDIDGERCEHGTSLPLGTLHLPLLRAAGAAKFSRRVHKYLASADWSVGENLPLFLVGGSSRALAHYAMHRLKWPLDDPHGFELPQDVALKLCRSLARQGKPAQGIPGVSSSRLAVLPDTAALLAVLLRELRPSKLVFSSWGLREGLLYKELDRAAQAQNPLLVGVAAFSEGLGSPASTAAMVAGWTADVSSSLGEQCEHLRLAATMLALAAHRVEPNLRTEQSVDWALRKRWIGLSAEGRVMIAAALAANTGRSVLSPELEQIASPACLREGHAWGLAIRLCRRFSTGSVQALSNSGLAIEGSQLVLTVREPLAVLCTDPVEKDLRQTAEWLDLKPSIKVVGPAARFD